MSVIFTISYYSPYVSGITIYIERLANELRKKGYDITVISTQYKKDLPTHELVNNIHIERVPYWFKISKGFFMPTYLINLWDLINNKDVVIVNLPQFEAFIPALIAKVFGKRLICIYHCEVNLPRGFFNKMIEFVLHIAHFITLIMVDRIIAYTNDYVVHSRLLPLFKNKTVTIYPLIPVPKINTSLKSNMRKKIPRRIKYILGVSARLASEKGVEYLLESIPALKKEFGEDFIILFAGPKNPVGEEKYLKRLSPLLKKHRKKIIFLGTIPSENIGSFYSLLDVLVLPSINSTEAFGIVQVEAMLCGVPVVATNLPGVRVPISKTGMGEIAKIKNSEDLARKIILILRNKKNYIRNRAHVEAIFGASRAISAYERILSS